MGRGEAAEAPPAEVPLAELMRRANFMFSGVTGAVVASGGTLATSAPTHGLIKDVIELVDDLPDALFDRRAEHRPCGLLCRYSAVGMLIGDVLGLPQMPWTLAEPIGKAAAKLKKEIAEAQKKAKKKAKRNGGDAEAAASAFLRGGVSLPLPSRDEIKAEMRRLAKLAHPPEPPPAPKPPPAPEPPAEPVLPPMPPEGTLGRAKLDMALSKEFAAVIIPASVIYYRKKLSRRAGSLDEDEELDHAQVELKHALRRLKRAHPAALEGCPWNEKSDLDILYFAAQIHSTGHIIPAAAASARRARFDLDRCATDFRRKLEAQLARDVPTAVGSGVESASG